MKKIFSLFTAVLFVGSMNATVIFHESFGDNSSSARVWSDEYSEKSGEAAAYADIDAYQITNAKQSKNTMGSEKSGLSQTTKGTDAVLIVGPLNVSTYSSLAVTYQWKAASVKETYSTDLYYATSSTGEYTKVEGTGNGDTKYVERSYSLPEAAQVSTLYLKVVWNTSNTNALIDELELTGTGSAPVIAVAKPVIDGEAAFFDEVEVSISCETEEAKIYYTLDGSEPSDASTPYEGVFKLTDAATVKAIAIKGEDKSVIAEKEFTKHPSFGSIEALVEADLASETLVKVSFSDVKIDSIFVTKSEKRQGIYLNVLDKTGLKDVEIYYNAVEVPAEWVAGGSVSGSIIGTWKYYEAGAVYEIVPSGGDWTWGNLIYKAGTATAIDNAAVEAKAVKAIENGMLVIEKDGVRYNVMGQIVR
jgi:hypothetical protein